MSVSERVNAQQWNHGLRRQVLVETLLKEIVNGQLRSGERLVTQPLARRFKVSHTPVREALVMLAGMGLLDVSPNCGAVVRQVTAREVREICQVRRALECEAVRLACGQIPHESLEILEQDLDRLLEETTLAAPENQRELVHQARAVDSRLHDLIAASCGNMFLGHELGRLKTLFRAFRDAAWEHSDSHSDYHRLAAEAREHLAIVKALQTDDRQAATRAMARHIASGITTWTRALPSNPPAPQGRRRKTAPVRETRNYR